MIMREKQIVLSSADVKTGGATLINLLLDRGALVTITGMRKNTETATLIKRVDDHLKRIASDGASYNRMRARFICVSSIHTSKTNIDDIFFSEWRKPIIGIVGQHGKTMAALWAEHLIGDAVVVGHTPERPLLSALGNRARVAVVELHGTAPSLPNVKTVSTDKLSALDVAKQAARLAGISEDRIKKRIASLPFAPSRQEVVYQSAKLKIIDDTMATEPDRSIVAIQKFGGQSCILIAGGDGQSDYSGWANAVQSHIRATNLILLDGSATKKMRRALGIWGKGIRSYTNLKSAYNFALRRARLFVSSVILFSPSARSKKRLADEFVRIRRKNGV